MIELDFTGGQVPPIIAILRGVLPDEVVEVSAELVAAGIRMIEVPLNSPNPLESIRRLVEAFGDQALCGAGTVVSASAVDQVAEAGGKLIVTPNTDPQVIAHAVSLGLTVAPGFSTPTEAYAAINAGARWLKLFPSGTFGPAHLKAVREVLPRDIPIFAVGGVNPNNLAAWMAAGAAGVGLGGDLYTSGRSAREVGDRAQSAVAAWRRYQANGA